MDDVISTTSSEGVSYEAGAAPMLVLSWLRFVPVIRYKCQAD